MSTESSRCLPCAQPAAPGPLAPIGDDDALSARVVQLELRATELEARLASLEQQSHRAAPAAATPERVPEGVPRRARDVTPVLQEQSPCAKKIYSLAALNHIRSEHVDGLVSKRTLLGKSKGIAEQYKNILPLSVPLGAGREVVVFASAAPGASGSAPATTKATSKVSSSTAGASKSRCTPAPVVAVVPVVPMPVAPVVATAAPIPTPAAPAPAAASEPVERIVRIVKNGYSVKGPASLLSRMSPSPVTVPPDDAPASLPPMPVCGASASASISVSVGTSGDGGGSPPSAASAQLQSFSCFNDPPALILPQFTDSFAAPALASSRSSEAVLAALLAEGGDL